MNSFLESTDGGVKPAVEPERSTPSLDTLPTNEFLKVVGLRVRAQRSTMTMSRKRLAEVSGVSERYLAQLESGQGNMSIALLRKVTTAIDLSLATLLSAEVPEMIESVASNSDAGDNTAKAVEGSATSLQPQSRFSRPDSPESMDAKSRLIPEY